MDVFLRFLIYVVLGAGLLFCNAVYIRSLLGAFRRDEIVIMPVSIVGQDDKDGKLGGVLARMLAIRLKTLEAEIMALQQANGVQVLAAIRSDAAPLEPLKIDAKVAGVDVGTVLPWVQNLLAQPSSVAFTLDFLDKDRVLVTGDLGRLSRGGRGVLSFESSTAHDKIVDDLAHAMVQARLESKMHNGVDTIPVADFRRVVKSLGQVALVNQAVARGEVAQSSELKSIVDGLAPVAGRLSSWWELNYVAALTAQRAADSNSALQFYQSVKNRGASPPVPAELAKLLSSGEIDQAVEAILKTRSSVTGVEEDTSKEAAQARPKIEADMAEAMTLYESLFSLQRPKLGLTLISQSDNNAFYSAIDNRFYAPAAIQYAPDITYHEVAHSFIESLGKVGYGGQSGSIIESYADACASWVTQKKAGQDAKDADWTIGAGGVAAILGEGDPRTNRTPIRSMKNPGKGSHVDPQVDHYSKVPTTGEIVHVAMGVPNKAFVETALRIGTDKAIRIWIAAMPSLKPNANLPDLASATVAAARSTQGEQAAAKVNEAWSLVGLPQSGR